MVALCFNDEWMISRIDNRCFASKYSLSRRRVWGGSKRDSDGLLLRSFRGYFRVREIMPKFRRVKTGQRIRTGPITSRECERNSIKCGDCFSKYSKYSTGWFTCKRPQSQASHGHERNNYRIARIWHQTDHRQQQQKTMEFLSLVMAQGSKLNAL